VATVLRELSYRYQWLYDAIARFSALGVGGENRFRQLALNGVTILPDTRVLDLCCGSGQATQFLVERSQQVTGLDASPLSLKRARKNVPEADYVEAWAEAMPFDDSEFDVVHTSVALHEMTAAQLRAILQEVYRVLKPGGTFTFVDFHQPGQPLFLPGLYLFLLLFETETAWQFINTDLEALLDEIGFEVRSCRLHAGGSLQVVQAGKR